MPEFQSHEEEGDDGVVEETKRQAGGLFGEASEPQAFTSSELLKRTATTEPAAGAKKCKTGAMLKFSSKVQTLTPQPGNQVPSCLKSDFGPKTEAAKFYHMTVEPKYMLSYNNVRVPPTV